MPGECGPTPEFAEKPETVFDEAGFEFEPGLFAKDDLRYWGEVGLDEFEGPDGGSRLDDPDMILF